MNEWAEQAAKCLHKILNFRHHSSKCHNIGLWNVGCNLRFISVFWSGILLPCVLFVYFLRHELNSPVIEVPYRDSVGTRQTEIMLGGNTRSRDSAVAGTDSAFLAIYSGPLGLRRSQPRYSRICKIYIL